MAHVACYESSAMHLRRCCDKRIRGCDSDTFASISVPPLSGNHGRVNRGSQEDTRRNELFCSYQFSLTYAGKHFSHHNCARSQDVLLTNERINKTHG